VVLLGFCFFFCFDSLLGSVFPFFLIELFTYLFLSFLFGVRPDTSTASYICLVVLEEQEDQVLFDISKEDFDAEIKRVKILRKERETYDGFVVVEWPVLAELS